MVVGIKPFRDSENPSEGSVKIWEEEACKLHQPLVRYVCCYLEFSRLHYKPWLSFIRIHRSGIKGVLECILQGVIYLMLFS